MTPKKGETFELRAGLVYVIPVRSAGWIIIFLFVMTFC